MADSDSSVTSKLNPPPSSPDPNPQSPPFDLNLSPPEANPQSASSEPNPSSSEANPPSSEANPPSSPSTSNSHVISCVEQGTFIDSLPAKIRSEHQEHLNKLFVFYNNRCITTAEFELYVLNVIKDVPIAVNAFKKLLPTANLIPFTSNKGKTIFHREGCYFNDKVRDYMMLWLENLTEFNNGNESFSEFRREVEPHFANMADLWKEFDAKFNPCHDALSFTDSKDDSNVNSDSSDKAPPSKARRIK